MTNDMLYERALEAARRLFEDTSVPAEVAIVNLENLIEEIQIWIESLR